MITVPEEFAIATIHREGEAGRAWIDRLPALFEALCKRWQLVVDGPVMHGYLGLVVPVLRDQEPCALKVPWLDSTTTDEAAALSAWEGRGAVRLLEREPVSGAMLLERLDHTRSLNNVAIDEAVAIAGRLLRRLAIPVSASFPSLDAMQENLAQNLPERWERYGRPVPRRLFDRACETLAEIGPSRNKLLVNYDLFYADVLAGTREPWLVVDPKVVVGDPEFGIAQLLWRRLEEMQAQGGLERHFPALIEAAELDLDLARSWTVVRCVDYWLWGLSVGLTFDPARCEVIIQWLLQPENSHVATFR